MLPTARTAASLLVGAATVATGSWMSQTTGMTGEMRGLSVVDERTVWASGTGGRVIRTADGGATWRVDTVPGAATLDLRDIFALDGNTAYAMSAGEAEKGQAKIFKTADAGRTWSQVFTSDQPGVFLDALAFWDRDHGIALSDPVGGKWTLFRTDDAGATWTRIDPAVLPPMLEGEAAFAASGTSIALAGRASVWIGSGGAAKARVFRSTDRGATWTVAETPMHSGGGNAGIFSVAFADSLKGVVVGGDYSKARTSFPNVALTSDGGRSWRLASGPLPLGYMSAVSYVPGTNAQSLVAVGLGGTATSADGGESWTMADTLGYNSVAFASRSAGWTVGPRGRVARWDSPIGIPVRK